MSFNATMDKELEDERKNNNSCRICSLTSESDTSKIVMKKIVLEQRNSNASAVFVIVIPSIIPSSTSSWL